MPVARRCSTWRPQQRDRRVRRRARRPRSAGGRVPRRDGAEEARRGAHGVECGRTRRRRGDLGVRHGRRQERRAPGRARRRHRVARLVRQEIGRAARDGQPARAILHYRAEDFSLRSFFAGGHTKRADIAGVWDALLRATTPLRAKGIADESGRSTRAIGRVLNQLVACGLAVSGLRASRCTNGCRRATRSARCASATRPRSASARRASRSCADTPRRPTAVGALSWSTSASPPPSSAGRATAATAARRPRSRRTAPRTQTTAASGSTRRRARRVGTGTVMGIEDDRLTVFFAEHG